MKLCVSFSLNKNINCMLYVSHVQCLVMHSVDLFESSVRLSKPEVFENLSKPEVFISARGI